MSFVCILDSFVDGLTLRKERNGPGSYASNHFFLVCGKSQVMFLFFMRHASAFSQMYCLRRTKKLLYSRAINMLSAHVAAAESFLVTFSTWNVVKFKSHAGINLVQVVPDLSIYNS